MGFQDSFKDLLGLTKESLNKYQPNKNNLQRENSSDKCFPLQFHSNNKLLFCYFFNFPLPDPNNLPRNLTTRR